MARAPLIAILVGLAGVAGVAPCAAVPADSIGTLYALIAPQSSLQVGCFGGCECPVEILPTYGSFVLVQKSVDPLYTNYEVRNYIASFNNGPGAVSIVGSGRYRIGGEFALVHQLTLDLSIWGKPTQHFDSGLIPVSAPFPRIDIACAVHGFACEDTVLAVDASPAGTVGVPTAGPGAAALAPIRPNPFRGEADITLTLPRPGPFQLVIVDLVGRRVRDLADGRSGWAGPQTLHWDGRGDDGRVAPAGIYWALLRSADGRDQRRLVKLD